MKISFDFDGTLALSYVQEYAKTLIKKGIDVHIVTSRVSDIPEWNDDLFKVADNLGIKKENIHFTEGNPKVNFFINNSEFIWHLDDDYSEILDFKYKPECKTVPISVMSSNFINKCNRLISNEEKKR